VVVQCSPFYHGVRLLQCAVWGEFPVGEIARHFLVLLGFALFLGFAAFRRVNRKLTL